MRRIILVLAAIVSLVSCTKEVKVSLDKSELTLEKSTVAVLTVKCTPANAAGKTLTWVSSNPEVATVTANGNEGIVLGLDAGTAEISVSCGDNMDKCTVTVVIPATSISLDKESILLTLGASRKLTAMLEPANSTDAVVWTSSNKSVATVEDGTVKAVAVGSAVITAKAGQAEASCEVTVRDVSSDGAVDLGLSVFWATCNVGADKPEDNGNFYAWGETETKDSYTVQNYKWCQGTYNSLTKYCVHSSLGVVDNKLVLEPEDDVATVTLSGTWRMPTYEEWTELKDNCDWTWTELNGKGGYKVSAKTSPDKWIFLPVSGYYYDKEYSNSNVLGQYHGLYWSSSLSKTNSSPWTLHFTSYTEDIVISYNSYGRFYGATVRPVME